MLLGGGIIRSLMAKRGYRHRKTDDEFIISGEYTRNLQYVYSKEMRTRSGIVIDMVYFGVDIFNEKMVIGLYRENLDVENGVYENKTRSFKLTEFSDETVESELNKLLTPIREIL